MNKPRFALFALVCLLAVLCLPGGALAAADTDFVSKLVSSFYDKTSAWEPILKKYALLVFRWLLILEVCFLGIKAALNREQVGDIFKHFVMAVINNYKEWSWNLIDGLKQIGFELSSPQYSSDSAFIAGLKIVNLILSKLSAWSPGNSVALLLAALVVMVCFALISAQVVFIKCEAMIAMMAALILVSFGGSSFLKDYAVNALRYVLAVAFKLFVMQLVLGVGLAFIQDFDTSTAELQDIFIVIGASIVLLALVKSIPDTCAGIINGSHVSGGAAITAATAAVGGAVAGAVGGSIAAGRSAAVTTQNVKDASNIAGMEGKSGMGKGVSVARSMWGARQDAKTAGEKALATRSRSEMKERLERARMATESDNS